MKKYVQAMSRTRNFYLIFGVLITLLAYTLVDPNNQLIAKLPYGAGTISMIVLLMRSMVAITGLHLLRKWIFDYDAADFEVLGIIAKGTPQGAGLYSIAIAIQTLAMAIVIAAVVFASL